MVFCAFLQELFYSKRSNEAEWWRKGSSAPLSWYKNPSYISLQYFLNTKHEQRPWTVLSAFLHRFNGFSSKKLSVMSPTLQEILVQLTYFDNKKNLLCNQKSWNLKGFLTVEWQSRLNFSKSYISMNFAVKRLKLIFKPSEILNYGLKPLKSPKKLRISSSENVSTVR